MKFADHAIYNLPVLPLRGLVVFPKTLLHFDVGRKLSKNAINISMRENQLIFLVSQVDAANSNPTTDGLYLTGVIAKIVQVLKQPDDITRIVVEGIERANVKEYQETDDCFFAQVEVLKSVLDNDSKETALIRKVKTCFEEYARISPQIPTDIMFKIALCKDGGELSDFIANNIILEYEQKQRLLYTFLVKDRLSLLLDMLNEELYVMELEREIGEKARNKIDKHQREYLLREQKQVIEEELGDTDLISESEQYSLKIKELNLDEKSENILLKECRKLSKMPFGSQEVSVIKTYLDNVLELPWNYTTKDKIDLDKVRKTLDKNHFGLTKVKEMIVEHLAVRKLNETVKGQIICLVGPPGVGKTSIAQSVAGAIGRNYSGIALGGVHDEAEIRGHRRTYIGALPGRIINAVKNAGSINPVIVLDEIDKLASDYKGDPSSALLEVLDNEQNNKFVDHYIDIPFDLSKVLFITTANDASKIPPALYDRMEIIEIESYTREEKFSIAKKHLIPKQIKENGLNNKIVKINNKAIYSIIDYYTKEAGVRTLERRIGKLLRKVVVKYLDNNEEIFKITDKNIQDYLGVHRYSKDKLSKKDEIGVVNGLAWTSIGGTLLPIEVAVMPGDGKILLTGSLGDVMQESAKAAITCIRSHCQILGIDSDFYKKFDLHIHAPEGAVPKDGPSAGITMATAIYSALTMRPVKKGIAMTGEITLRGNILPIGGLKEKSMAAYSCGIKKVFIPNDNIPTLEEIDPIVKESVEFIPVTHFTEVINNATINPIIADDLNKSIIIPETSTQNTSSIRQ